MGNSPKVQGNRQARAAAARKAAQAKERRRRIIATVAGLVVVLAVVGVFVGVSLSHKGNSSSSKVSSGQPGPVPSWPAPTGAAGLQAVHSAGLQAYGREMLTYHVHAHLDVIDNGKPVTVPAQIGFAYNSAGQPDALSALHTHAPDGIIHIEAPKKVDYTLGQFFKEWQVPLSSTCVGKLCADNAHTLQFFVDGKRYTGDPTAIVLHPHGEIAVVYASKGSSVKAPSSYQFPAGD